jgi:hypothetical protein
MWQYIFMLLDSLYKIAVILFVAKAFGWIRGAVSGSEPSPATSITKDISTGSNSSANNNNPLAGLLNAFGPAMQDIMKQVEVSQEPRTSAKAPSSGKSEPQIEPAD